MTTPRTTTRTLTRSARPVATVLLSAASAALLLSPVPAFAAGARASASPPSSPTAAPAVPVEAQQGGARADRQRLPRVVHAWARAWNTGSPERMASLFTEDGVYEDFAFGARFVGRDGVASWVRTTNDAIADARVTVTDAFRAGNRVSVRWTFSGQVTGAPTPFRVPATTVMELDRGKIAYNGDYYNLAEVLRQSGLPAGPPAPANPSP